MVKAEPNRLISLKFIENLELLNHMLLSPESNLVRLFLVEFNQFF